MTISYHPLRYFLFAGILLGSLGLLTSCQQENEIIMRRSTPEEKKPEPPKEESSPQKSIADSTPKTPPPPKKKEPRKEKPMFKKELEDWLNDSQHSEKTSEIAMEDSDKTSESSEEKSEEGTGPIDSPLLPQELQKWLNEPPLSRKKIVVLSPPTASEIRKRSPSTAQITRQWQGLKNKGQKMASRELFWFINNALDNGSHDKEILEALDLAVKMQDRDPKSRSYGNFKWYLSDKKPGDLNSVQFCMSEANEIWYKHHEKMKPKVKSKMKDIMEVASHGVLSHGVGVGYTNIFLKKSWNCIALGEILNKKSLAKTGEKMLQDWLDFTYKQGVPEYLSSTYYNVNFGVLDKIAMYPSDPKIRRQGAAALCYFFTEVAANWFTPIHRLGGACSREYNFQVGINALKKRMDPVLKNKGHALVPSADLQFKGWGGPKMLVDITKTVPRMVRQRWGNKPYQVACQYISKNFSLGTAGASYGSMDRPLTINVAGKKGERVPFINFIMDARNDPYSSKPYPLGNSHLRASHLIPFIGNVQRDAEALFVAYDNPNRWNSTFWRRAGAGLHPMPTTHLLSHITFPSRTEVWVNNEKVMTSKKNKKETIEVPKQALVSLKLNDVIACFRILAAEGPKGTDSPIQLVKDQDGLQRNVMRLTITHSDKKPDGKGIVAFWVRVEENLNSSEFASLRDEMLKVIPDVQLSKSKISVSVPGKIEPLRLKMDLKNEEIDVNSGAEKGAYKAKLSINGIDFGKVILDNFK